MIERNEFSVFKCAYFCVGQNSRRASIDQSIMQLLMHLKGRGVPTPKLQICDGKTDFAEFDRLLNSRWKERIYNSWETISAEIGMHLDPTLSDILSKVGVQNSWIEETKSALASLTRDKIPNLVILDFDEGANIGGNAVWHGAAQGNAKNDIAFVGFNQRYHQLIFHEILHFLGADDGYDDETYKTHKGCESCWMQFEPSKGTGLCEFHLIQVKEFVSSL